MTIDEWARTLTPQDIEDAKVVLEGLGALAAMLNADFETARRQRAETSQSRPWVPATWTKEDERAFKALERRLMRVEALIASHTRALLEVS